MSIKLKAFYILERDMSLLHQYRTVFEITVI